ncbi:outer membrane protein assembly factor BamA [Buchnera aphidicola]|uniref:Outer membrane protein assembly factor BamA n=1 Tax=Buchnera aphidicola subsp. Uroleucon sonchi TaxID=118118 RepID=A0A6C1FAN5_BUCUN|nr:outer membrane protein assembly factor BamA [Buchnera aphidicola]QIE01964.1 outer membrane protein assembly factor BamA [Buchnera aphidicola (Uroleucon sonchi)]
MFIKKFFITFLVLFSISSHAKNIGIINNIQFEGLHNVSKNEASKHIILDIGNVISEYDVKNSIKSLFATGKFQDIKVIYSKKSIIFRVKEKPIISNVIFTGNHIIKNSVLNLYLQKLNIKKGSVFDPLSINILIKTIEDFFYNIGRFESNVQIFKQSSEDNTINLKIIFNEGIIKKINSIKILGAKHFSEQQVTSLLQSKNYSIKCNFFETCVYSPQKLDQDLKRLNNFYLNHGYFYFHINDKKIDFINNKNQIDIKINISEGEKYHISQIFFLGNFNPYKKLIKKFVTINNNELYNQEKINNIIHEITKFLSDHGYINAIVQVQPEVNNKTKTIVLNFYIDIKQRFFVHRIHFIGNTITQDKVLRREIKQIEGKYIDLHLINLGKKSLEKTKYFKNIEIIKKIYSPNSNQIDIFYKVHEQPTGSINFGLGYGVDNGINFNAALSKDNIFGSGNSFKASIIKNDNQKYADISISYPYFISNIKDLNTRLFYNDLKYNFDSSSDFSKTTYGLESNLGIKINDYNKINFGFGYTHNGIKNKENITNPDDARNTSMDLMFLKNKRVNDFTLNYSWIYSTLESLYFPISGHQIYISGKNTTPGSDNNFYKFILDNENYLPLDKKKDFIFFSHVHLGVGNIFNKEKLPFYENFYSNHESNIRGFRLNTIGPKKIYNISNAKNCTGYINNHACESIDTIGGNTSFTTNLEMITHIPFIQRQYSHYLRTSLFLDVGNIWDVSLDDDKKIHEFSFKDDILNNIYSSIGVSLQWLSPIGPLFFSYALPIQQNKNSQLEPFQFHFGKNW